MSYKRIERCRLSGSSHLIPILDLGTQKLTGVFPKTQNEEVPTGPLELLWCPDSGLVQLAHSFDPKQMYGDNYGYRSGLNQSMVQHLTQKARHLEQFVSAGDTVLDIGSNDCTLLKAYQNHALHLVGFDPTATKFMEFYPDHVQVVSDFFSASKYWAQTGARQPKLITSIAMVYDLENPLQFAEDVHEILTPDGLWHLEQSYMPKMLQQGSYDTICHEHLEFYSLRVIRQLLIDSRFKIVDIRMNNINGGSFAVTAAKVDNDNIDDEKASEIVDVFIDQEDAMELYTPKPYRKFEQRVFKQRSSLRALIETLNYQGKLVLGYGASTKGNVLLQFCNFTEADIHAIVDVNPDKHGRFTPGSRIPIVSEADAEKMVVDYYLVLPWHFREGIIKREQQFLERGGRLIFPFPEIEIV